MGLVDYAAEELKFLSESEDEMNQAMAKDVMQMVETFANQGHSGFSANYALSLLKLLLDYKPLSPLTGEDDEWGPVNEDGIQQNKRLFSVFKQDGKVYDIEGKVFVEENGCAYTSRDSRVEVTFPYTQKIEYVKVKSEDKDGHSISE